MAISGNYQSVIQASPGGAGKTLSFKSGLIGSVYYDGAATSGYGVFEWSYVATSATNYEIRGGTDLACEQGAAALLEALGFRFYMPKTTFWKQPAIINMGLSAAKQKFLMPDNYLALAYGHGGRNPALADWNKWITLVGFHREYYTAGHRWQSIGADLSIENSGFWSTIPGVRTDSKEVVTPEASATFVPDGAPPTGNAPIIALTTSSNSMYERGSRAIAFDFVTDGDDGNLKLVATTSATPPSVAQVKNGQNHLGATVPSRTLAVTASGAYNKYAITGLAWNTTYHLYGVHTNGVGDSTVVYAGSRTTLAPYHYFNLQYAIDNGYYNTLVDICAAWQLTAGFNDLNFSDFDAPDGDSQSSNLVFPFVKAVAGKCRTGTAAIGPYGAKAANPNASLGLYAYAGHRRPPTISASPGVITQIALGFNRTELTYQQLVKGHAEKCDAVKLREYWGTQLWDRSQPLRNGRTLSNYFSSYTDPNPESGYIAAAAAAAGGGKELLGVHAECSANNLANIVMFRWGILTCRGVSTTYAACLQEIVNDIFGGDPKVVELYELFSDSFNRWHRFTLQTAMEIIAQMQNAWYRPLFKYWMVFCYEWLTLPSQTAPANQGPSDPFPAAFSKMMAHAWALENEYIIQSYAVVRAEANGAVAANYPSLRYTNNPSWYTSPYMPTEGEFDTYLAALQAANDRDPDLDSEDLVVVRNITPRTTPTTPAQAHYVRGPARYVFVGPGTVTIDENDTTFENESGQIEVIEGGTTPLFFPAGKHVFEVLETATVSCDMGDLFLYTFPFVARYNNENNPALGGENWLYIQESARDNVQIEPGSRVRIIDQNGQVDILPPGHASYAGPYTSFGPGQVRIDNLNTQGINTITVNPYLSLDPETQIMPRAVAEAEFPARIKIRRGSAFAA